jgi:hypothetical protein
MGKSALMSEAGNHIRQEKRKEIHEPFLESSISQAANLQHIYG